MRVKSKKRRALLEARRSAARRARRKQLLIGNRNDLLLTEIYRRQLREDNLVNSKRNIGSIMDIVFEIVELKRRRNGSLLQLTNINVDIMVDQMEKIISKIHQSFAQYVPPVTITVEESKLNVRKRMEELYALFKDQFFFSIPEDYYLKYTGFSKDTLSIKSAAMSPEEENALKAMEIQKRNLIKEVEEEEIRTIAAEQILQEKIEKLELEIEEIKAGK